MHAPQVIAAASQMGALAGQSVEERHPTHVRLAGLHAGADIGQSPFVRHATQTFDTVSHLGVAPLQFVSLVQGTH